MRRGRAFLLTPETHVASTVEDLLSEEAFLADPLWVSRSPSSFPRIPAPDRHRQGRDPVLRPNSRFPVGGGRPVSGGPHPVRRNGAGGVGHRLQEKQYRLSDGTVLLQEFPPQTDFSNDYVGNIPLSELPPPCRTASGAIIRTAVPSMT